MNKELKPCPFCGGEAEKEWGIPSIFWIKCTGCGVEGSQHGSLEEAIKAWNTRKPIDKVVEQLEAIQNFEMRTGKCYCPDANEEDCRYAFSDLSCAYCSIEKAIEIVKGGAE